MLARALAGLAVAATLAALAPTAAAESDVTLTGRLEVLHADHFAQDRAVHTYALRGDDGRATPLRFGDEGPYGLGGQQVTVRGQRRGDAVEVARAEDAQPAQDGGTAAVPAPGVTRYAVVLLEFSDAPLQVTREQVAEHVFGSLTQTKTVRDFYLDNSFGALDINASTTPDADVFQTVTISASVNDSCAYRAWGDEARAKAATLYNFDDSAYTHVAHVMPKSTCSFSGIAELPGKYTWNVSEGVDDTDPASGRWLRGLLEHELGHNLAAYHGASYACTDNRGTPVPLGSRCTHSEYGDPFTVMGVARGERTFNAVQKARVSWYATQQGREPWLDLSPGADVTTVTTTTRGIVLAPIDRNDPGVQVLRVPKPGRGGHFYYVELRSGAGYDETDGLREEPTQGSKAVLGFTIRFAPDHATGAASRLLDMTPGSPGGFTDAALAPGASFTDGGLTIRHTTAADGSPTIDVEIISTKRNPR